jgi:hypothetical protein
MQRFFFSGQEPEGIIVLIQIGTYLFLLIIWMLLIKLKTNSEKTFIIWNLNPDKLSRLLSIQKITGKTGWPTLLFITTLKKKVSGYED